MGEGTTQYRDRLLVEDIARTLGFDWLATRLPGDVYPPYLYYGSLVVFEVFVLNTYKHLTGGTHAFLATPTWAAIPVGLLLGVVGVRYMADGYADAVAGLRVNDRVDDGDTAAFERMVPRRVKLAVYVVAVVCYFLNLFVFTGAGEILAYEGPVVFVVSYLFLMPFVYVPLVVEFALVYFGIHFLVPHRIDRANLGLFFYDPRNMGGFADVGQLLKRSYYLYTAGLLLYFLLVYGPFILSQFGTIPIPEPSLFVAAFFSAAWLVGLASIAHSMVRLHRIMAAEKRERIRELETEMRDIIDNPYDINASAVDDTERLEDIRRRLEQVRNTRVYPATFTMWSQIAISVILPQVLQFAVRVTA
jgi:hypothetical protein